MTRSSPQPNINTRTSHLALLMAPAWSWLLALAIAILATGCGGPTDAAASDWDCAFEMPAHDGEEKRNLAKYHGRYNATESPCYSNNITHNCLFLPYTKTFTWHWTNSFEGLLQADDWMAVQGFKAAMTYLGQQGTGFTFTQVETPTGLPNDIPITWAWEPTADYFAEGGCTSFHALHQNVPGAVNQVSYYKGCHMKLNVPTMADVAATWAALGYETTPWGAGWAVANHEFGHIMGFAHSITGGMAAEIPVIEIETTDYTEAQYQVMTVFNPNGSSTFTLHTIPGFTPVTSE